ncbi:hypothetical protein AKJ09_09435 [Labilithrix luteola]|uniref:Lipoprotein n=1 Tax=Labilithrix luteola TaxID=1391654 RepID=A0A0K1QAT7_9BACT|nr:hypothetical protein [Labilithrix luteola]AKV02772.1 hypothetical protein AKJ09_09435 [Labilithrix luteola]
MKLKQIHRGLVLAAVASSFALGCELVVDFDRTKIPVETTDSGAADSSTVADAGTDATDASVVDGSDASNDASDAADQ